MKPISPGLSRPREELSRWPRVEHRGVWTVLSGWDADCYTALRRTLGIFNTWGDHLTAQILWLYAHNLNLPLKYEDDEVLIWQCVMDHYGRMTEGFGLKKLAPDRETVANTYAEQMAKLLGASA